LDLASSILIDGATFGFVGLGIMLIFAWAKVADLTPDASFTAGAVGAWLAASATDATGLQLILAGGLAGCVVGFCTFAITRLGVQQLLASLIVVGGAYSVHWFLMGRPLQSLPASASIFRGDNSSIDASLAVTLVVVAAALVGVFGNTALGLKIRAASENANSVPAGSQWSIFSTFLLVTIGNGLVGIGGSMFASRAYFVEINMGAGVLISGLGAFLLGWALFGFRASPTAAIAGAIFGALLLRGVMTLSLTLGVSAEWFRAISSIALLVCILIARGGARAALKDLRL
jgi:putative ABC transport system permease protein